MLDLTEIIRANEGPPVNVEAIIRSLGIELDKRAELDPEVSGLIEQLPSGKYRIAVNKADHYYRQRFTMAHELAHYLFHMHLLGDGVDDNRAYRSTGSGGHYNRNITQREESEANRFAASILMPSDLVARLRSEGLSHDELAKRFQVSSQAMAIRLNSLDAL